MNELTIYICTFDEEGNIEKCILSLKSACIEKVVVIDASEDDLTSSLALQSGAEVIKAKKGLAGQRQIAIDDCQTNFMMFVDADDRLHSDCIDVLLNEMNENSYEAIQASLRVYAPATYWEKGMDANLAYCVNKAGETNMVGRPAIYKTKTLKKVGMDLNFNGVGNEDAALSISLEAIGVRQGKGTGVSYRHHPKRLSENFKAWKKYGLGDAQVVKKYPRKTLSVFSHLLYVYPVKRSVLLVKNNNSRYVGFLVLQSVTRLAYLFYGLIFRNKY